MPFTPEQKLRGLQMLELDPNQWDLAEDGSAIPRSAVASQPLSGANQPPNASVGYALKLGAKNAIGPTIGGVGGFEAGFMGGAALAPLAGPLAPAAPFLGGIIGMLAGGKLGHVAQNKVEPLVRGESTEQTGSRQAVESAIAEQRPYMTAAGGLIPQAATFQLNPLSMLKAAGNAGEKLLLRTAGDVAPSLLPLEKQALLNLGTGAALGVGVPLVQGETDPGQLAIGLAGGTMFGAPRSGVAKVLGKSAAPTDYTARQKGPIEVVEENVFKDAEAAKAKEAEAASVKKSLVPVDDPRMQVAAERENLFKIKSREVRQENANALKLGVKGARELTPEEITSLAQERTDTEFEQYLAKRKVDQNQKQFDLGEQDATQPSPFTSKNEDGTYVRNDVAANIKTYAPELLKTHPIKPEEAGQYPYGVRLEEGELRRLLDNKVYGQEGFAAIKESNKIAEQTIKDKATAAKAKQTEAEIKQAEAIQEAARIEEANRLNEQEAKFDEQRIASGEATFAQIQAERAAKQERIKTEKRRAAVLGNQLDARESTRLPVDSVATKLYPGGKLKQTEPAGGTKFQGGVQEERPIGPVNEEASPAPYVTKQELDTMAGEGISKVTLRKQTNLADPLGSISGDRSSVTLNSNRDATTAFHETLHKRVEDIQRDPEASKTAKELVERALKLSGEVDPLLADEALVAGAGREATKIAIARRSIGGRIKRFWSDWKAAHRYSNDRGSFEDAQALLARRLHDDPNYYESGLAARDIQVISEGKGRVGESGDGTVKYDSARATPAISDSSSLLPSRDAVSKETPTEKQRKLEAIPEEHFNDHKEQSHPYTTAELEKAYAQRVSEGRSAKLNPIERIMAPVNDKVAHIELGNNPSAHYASEKLGKATFNKGYYWGHFVEVPGRELANYTPAIQEAVFKKMEQEYRLRTPQSYTAEEAPLKNYLRKHFDAVRDEQIKRGILVSGRTGGKDPYYLPAIMGSKQLETMVRFPSSELGQKYMKDVIDHWATEAGVSKAEATKYLDNYLAAQGSQNNKATSDIEFGALRKAAGLGLPESVKEDNLFNVVTRYGKRVADDMAFFDAIQSDPTALAILGLRDQHGKLIDPSTVKLPTGETAQNIAGNQEVKDAVESLFNRGGSKNKEVSAITSLINTALIGPASGIRDVMTIPSTILPYGGARSALGDLGSAVKGAFDKELQARAIRSGSVRQRPQDRVYGESLNDKSYNPVVEKLNALSNFLYEAQQRGKLENGGRFVTQAYGEMFVDRAFNDAVGGNSKAKEVLTDFAKRALNKNETLVEAIKKGTLDEETKARLVKEFVNRTQQSYDANDLPKWALDGPYSWFFRISRWSIGKSNSVMKDVIQPAVRNNNYGPLLSYTLGSLVTGAAIQKINSYLNNKKDFNPTPTELAYDETTKSALVDGVINLAQLGAFAGFIGDLAKSGSNMALGHSMPRGFGAPVLNAVSEIGNDTSNLIAALGEAGNSAEKAEAILAFGEKVLKDHVQVARMIVNHTIDADENKRKEKFRDINIFRKITGDAAEGQNAAFIPQTNPFSKTKEREFKRTDDMGRAGELLGELLGEASQKYGSNPMEFKKYLDGLKKNSYQTMPNPEQRPDKLASYYRFLVETQGADAAQERLNDYMRQNVINKVKGELVPNL